MCSAATIRDLRTDVFHTKKVFFGFSSFIHSCASQPLPTGWLAILERHPLEWGFSPPSLDCREGARGGRGGRFLFPRFPPLFIPRFASQPSDLFQKRTRRKQPEAAAGISSDAHVDFSSSFSIYHSHRVFFFYTGTAVEPDLETGKKTIQFNRRLQSS